MNKEEMFAAIDTHYREHFKTTVKKLTGSFGNSAEDVVQSAYTRALEYYNSFEEKNGSFSNWFSGILKNCIRDQAKDNTLHGMNGEAPETGIEIETSILDRIDINKIKEEIATYPEHIRNILEMNFMKGMSSTDIAKVVPNKIRQVRSHIEGFRRLIKEKFNRS